MQRSGVRSPCRPPSFLRISFITSSRVMTADSPIRARRQMHPSRGRRLRRERGGPVCGHPQRGHETASNNTAMSEFSAASSACECDQIVTTPADWHEGETRLTPSACGCGPWSVSFRPQYPGPQSRSASSSFLVKSTLRSTDRLSKYSSHPSNNLDEDDLSQAPLPQQSVHRNTHECLWLLC